MPGPDPRQLVPAHEGATSGPPSPATLRFLSPGIRTPEESRQETGTPSRLSWSSPRPIPPPHLHRLERASGGFQTQRTYKRTMTAREATIPGGHGRIGVEVQTHLRARLAPEKPHRFPTKSPKRSGADTLSSSPSSARIGGGRASVTALLLGPENMSKIFTFSSQLHHSIPHSYLLHMK